LPIGTGHFAYADFGALPDTPVTTFDVGSIPSITNIELGTFPRLDLTPITIDRTVEVLPPQTIVVNVNFDFGATTADPVVTPPLSNNNTGNTNTGGVPTAPTVFVVNNTNDDGPGSLRQAIHDANAH